MGVCCPLRDAGGEQRKVQGVAAVEGQLGDLFGFNRLAQGGIGRVDQKDGTCDLDSGGRFAGLKGKVERT